MKKKWHDFAKGLLIIFCFFLIVELVGCKKKKLNVDVNRVYQITYHLNGAVDLDLPTTFTKKNQIILKTPFRAEYRFDGWYFSSDFGGEKVTENSPVVPAVSSKDLSKFSKSEDSNPSGKL